MRIEEPLTLFSFIEQLDRGSSESCLAVEASLILSLKEACSSFLAVRNKEQQLPNLSSPFSASDIFHFGERWASIQKEASVSDVVNEIIKRRAEISDQRIFWASSCNREIEAYIQSLLNKGYCERIKQGLGGAYIVYDERKLPRFVIKPEDEGILCLNNYKQFGSPFNDCKWRARDEIPLYRCAQTETLAYVIAKELQVDSITPPTYLTLLNSTDFYDLYQALPIEKQSAFLEETGPPSFIKLCSAQEYVQGAQTMQDVFYSWLEEELSDDEIEKRLDQDDFEAANLLIWACYDTDAHGSNFMLYKKGMDAENNPVFGIKKIDNALSFPDKNKDFLNLLMFLPNATRPLSRSAVQKIAELSLPSALEHIEKLGLASAKDAFIERITTLKELCQRDGISIYEINVRLAALACPGGLELALSSIPLKEIESMVSLKLAGPLENESG